MVWAREWAWWFCLKRRYRWTVSWLTFCPSFSQRNGDSRATTVGAVAATCST